MIIATLIRLISRFLKGRGQDANADGTTVASRSRRAGA
jgi:hypothetical protein